MGKNHLKKEPDKFTYWAINEEDVVRTSSRFALWLAEDGGIDVYRDADDLSARNWFVRKGSVCHNRQASLVARCTERARITIELFPKMLEGIVWENDEIVDISLDDVDPDVLPIDLRTLSTTEARKLDDALTQFFYLKGSKQGARAKDGDGRNGIFPWARGLEYGKTASDIESIVDETPGMGGKYLDTMWEAFEAGLPKGLTVVGDEGSGDRWSIERILRFDCPNCSASLTGRDEASRTCDGCGAALDVYATLPIVCETEGCPGFGKKINTIEVFKGSEDEINEFYEQFGYGSVDPSDFCPGCKKLGVLKDPILSEVNDANVRREGDEEQSNIGLPSDQRPE